MKTQAPATPTKAKLARSTPKIPAPAKPTRAANETIEAIQPAPSPVSKKRALKDGVAVSAPKLAPPSLASDSTTNAFECATKQAQLIQMLRSAPGATIEQIVRLTDWQAHTVRGTISGVLRKRLGLTVTCEPASGSGPRVYRIVEDQSA